MLFFRVRNFDQFQHYKHRNPPWIRLYYQLLHDRRFFRLDDSTKWLAVGCFLLASQCENKIPFDRDWIAKELSLSETPKWQELIESEFIQPIDCDASTMLAGCLQDASQSRVDNSDHSEAEILSISRKSVKSSFREASEIFRYWNNQTATMHHRAINGQEKAIMQTLRKYSSEEILRAIERYTIVRENKSGKYRNLYQWTLGEFLTRKNHYNIERFISEKWEGPFLNFGEEIEIKPEVARCSTCNCIGVVVRKGDKILPWSLEREVKQELKPEVCPECKGRNRLNTPGLPDLKF
jgi:hypothetical protein